MGVLQESWGPQRLEAWLRALSANDVAIAPGNAAVRDLVASGERAVGVTDTDDAHGAILDGRPVGVVVPEDGPALIPNTVALVAGCPHPEAGRALVDFLLEGVALHAELMQPDGIHPNAAGQEVVFANVWRVLRPLLAPHDAP